MTLPNGLHLLVHIGINRAKPDANNFQYHVKAGDYVSLGADIVTLSDNLLKVLIIRLLPLLLFATMNLTLLKHLLLLHLLKLVKPFLLIND